MSSPLFTIVTVTLNAGQDLAGTVSSVDGQRDADYEHLVKDGGSRDGSIERLPDSPRRRVVARADQGIYAAMNQAIELAAGEYILFLNAGDELVSATALRDAAVEVGRSRADVVYCDVQDLDRGAVIRYPDALSEFFFYRTGICHQACFVKTALYREQRGFDPTLRIAADHEFLVRAFRAGARFSRAPMTVTRYKGAGFSAAETNRRALARDIAAVRARHFSRGQRIAYRCVWEATLPRVRGLINRSSALRPLRPMYANVVNAVYGVRGAIRALRGEKQ